MDLIYMMHRKMKRFAWCSIVLIIDDFSGMSSYQSGAQSISLSKLKDMQNITLRNASIWDIVAI